MMLSGGPSNSSKRSARDLYKKLQLRGLIDCILKKGRFDDLEVLCSCSPKGFSKIKYFFSYEAPILKKGDIKFTRSNFTLSLLAHLQKRIEQNPRGSHDDIDSFVRLLKKYGSQSENSEKVLRRYADFHLKSIRCYCDEETYKKISDTVNPLFPEIKTR